MSTTKRTSSSTTARAKAKLDARGVEALRAGLRGEALLPGDADYDAARRGSPVRLPKRPPKGASPETSAAAL